MIKVKPLKNLRTYRAVRNIIRLAETKLGLLTGEMDICLLRTKPLDRRLGINRLNIVNIHLIHLMFESQVTLWKEISPDTWQKSVFLKVLNGQLCWIGQAAIPNGLSRALSILQNKRNILNRHWNTCIFYIKLFKKGNFGPSEESPRRIERLFQFQTGPSNICFSLLQNIFSICFSPLLTAQILSCSTLNLGKKSLE